VDREHASPELGSGPLLVVAPHPDDAALSCSALLDSPGPVDVLTVLTGAPEPPRRGFWDARCGFAGSEQSVPARRREEVRALENAVRRLELLEIVDHQYLDGPRPDAHRTAVVEWVTGWVAKAGSPCAVALPAGAGWRPGRIASWLVRRGLARQPGPSPSPDHVFVRDAVLGGLAGTAGVELVLYEELPYRWGGQAGGEARRSAETHALRAVPFSLRVDRDAKARRIGVYESQVPHISPPHGRIDNPAVLPETERYWRLVRE